MDVEEFLEHHGVKGQKWGVISRSVSRFKQGRQQHKARLSRIANGTASRQDKALVNFRRGAIGAGVIGATALTTSILAARGTMTLSEANSLANARSGQLIRDVGHQFVKDNIDKQVVLNFGRQVKEGLVTFN